MATEAVIDTFSAVLLSYKKGQNWSFLETQMNPETVIQWQVGHKEKNKYCMFPVAQTEKNLPVKQETRVQPLG